MFSKIVQGWYLHCTLLHLFFNLLMTSFFDVTDSVNGLTQNVFPQRWYFCTKRMSKIVVPAKEMLLSFSIVRFYD